jgi:hypothetical protein
MVEELLPALNGTIILIGRSGHSARAPKLGAMLATATTAAIRAFRIMVPSR